MYFVHQKEKKFISHIVKSEDWANGEEFLREKGDVLCLQLSGIRKNNEKVKKKWTLRSTYSGTLCRNCLIVEEKMIQESLKLQREKFRTLSQNNSDIDVR
jgi:hypothetical protein